MTKLKKSTIVFSIILVQSFLAIFSGLVVLYTKSGDMLPLNTYVGDVNISGLNKNKAIEKITLAYKDFKEKEIVTVTYNSDKYSISLKSIDAAIDADKTVDIIYDSVFGNSLQKVININFSSQSRVYNPYIVLNEGKLKKKIEEISSFVNSEAKDADIWVENDIVKKEPGTGGKRLNVEKALTSITKNLTQDFKLHTELRKGIDYEIVPIPPDRSLKDLERLNKVVSTYSTKIIDKSVLKDIEYAVNKINKQIIPGMTFDQDDSFEFSFIDAIESELSSQNSNYEAYSQVASTLHAALIKTGYKLKISRTPHDNTVEYIQAGLDVLIMDDKSDFQFTNTLEHPIGIFADVRDNVITVSIMGDSENDTLDRKIHTDVVQRFEPPLTVIENIRLKKGEQKVLSEGSEGIEVDVYLAVYNGKNIKEKFYVHTDVYKPRDRTIEVGPDSKITTENLK